MTEEAEGETPMIPPALMQHSIQHSKGKDCQQTLAFLANAIKEPGNMADDSVDPVVR
jgi:hypothetical protein